MAGDTGDFPMLSMAGALEGRSEGDMSVASAPITCVTPINKNSPVFFKRAP